MSICTICLCAFPNDDTVPEHLCGDGVWHYPASRICPRCGFATMRPGPQAWECGRRVDCGYSEHDMVDRRPAPPQASVEDPSRGADAPLAHQDEIARLTAERDEAREELAFIDRTYAKEADEKMTPRAQEMAGRSRWAQAMRDSLASVTRERDAAQATAERLRSALAELVACKDLKDWLETSWPPLGKPLPPEYDAKEADYARRKPLAWSAARAALGAASDSAKDKETGNG